jgi:hypothetical protein
MEKFENFITIRLLMQGKVSSCFDSIKIIYTNYYYYSSFFLKGSWKHYWKSNQSFYKKNS